MKDSENDITHLRQRTAAMQAILLAMLRAWREMEQMGASGDRGFAPATSLLALVQREWSAIAQALPPPEREGAKRHLDHWMAWFGTVI